MACRLAAIWKKSGPRLASSFYKLLRPISTHSRWLRIADEVKSAVQEKRPVVALESTIYTHGFPYPDNLALATRLEAIVRHNGGVPAHCAILDGVAHVGISPNDLSMLLDKGGALKVSRRDLAYIAGFGHGQAPTKVRKSQSGSTLNGGTTIAGTMILAHLAGIKVFATGGLGGVHRGAELTMDVSADLTELGRTPVAVISAGCKGFLDIARTLEYLETEGVPVMTFADGRQGQVPFPSFWSRESQQLSPFTVRDEYEAASIIHAQFGLGLKSGLFFANPVPAEHGIPFEEMSLIINEALQRADSAGIIGAANTPFVLQQIKELSQGRSIPANIALIEANVVRGTRVAVQLSRLESSQHDEATQENLNGLLPATAFLPEGSLNCTQIKVGARQYPADPVDILVAGSIAVDLACDHEPTDAAQSTPLLQTSNPSSIKQGIGGVGANIARAAHLVGARVLLCSTIGDDFAGRMLQDALGDAGVPHALARSRYPTAQYVAINNRSKSLVVAMADMKAFDHALVDEIPLPTHSTPKWVAVDANWSPGTLRRLLDYARKLGSKTAFEPVSVPKASRLFEQVNDSLIYPRHLVDISTPNKSELVEMFQAAQRQKLLEREDWWQVINSMGISFAGAQRELVLATSQLLVDEGIPQRSIQLLPFIPCILTKLGRDGVLLTRLLASSDPRLKQPRAAPYIISRASDNDLEVGGIYMRLFRVPETVSQDDIVSVNGAGDSFLGVLLAALRRDEVQVEDAVDLAQTASIMSLKDSSSVSPELASLRILTNNL